jgi:hypothetical protein
LLGSPPEKGWEEFASIAIVLKAAWWKGLVRESLFLEYLLRNWSAFDLDQILKEERNIKTTLKRTC